MSTDTDPAVELVARALYNLDRAPGIDHWADIRSVPASDAIDASVAKIRARVVLAALALAGRLLPPVVQTREERGTRIGDGSIITLAEAGRRYTLSAQSLRVRTISTLADDGSPYGGATLTGKWRNVDE